MFARPVPDAETFTLTRRLAASRAEVWSAFADLGRLRRWWGPAGWTFLDGSLDFRPGGVFIYALRAPSGAAILGTVRYRDIVAPSRLAFVQVHVAADRHPAPLPCVDGVVTLSESARGTVLECRCRRVTSPADVVDVAWPRPWAVDAAGAGRTDDARPRRHS